MPEPFDVNRPSRLLLRRAVCSGNMDMVRTVLDPPRGRPHKRYGKHYEFIVAQAIRCRQPDIARLLLGLAVPCPEEEREQHENSASYLLHHGLREACHAGYPDLVAHILEMERARMDYGSWFNCCRTILEIACDAGCEEAVRILLDAGVDPMGRGESHRDGDNDVPDKDMLGHYVYSTGSMFAAAVGGHVGVADILVHAPGFQLDEASWRLVARGVIECGQAVFLDWMLTRKVLDSGSPSDKSWVGEQFDLLGEACVWGNADILRTLDAHGLLLNRPVWALGLRPLPYFGPTTELAEPPPSYPKNRDCLLRRYGSQPPCLRFECPMLAAMSWSRADVVEFFLGLGWAPVEDILATSVGPLWKEGRFPRRAVRHMVKSGFWAWEARDMPPL
ncbi:hypothetical protein PG984_013926 [Apiospora sp. TS-2023a]